MSVLKFYKGLVSKRLNIMVISIAVYNVIVLQTNIDKYVYSILQLLLNTVQIKFDNSHLFSKVGKSFRPCADVFNN